MRLPQPVRENPFNQAFFVLVFATLTTASACWVPIEQGQAMESDLVKLKSDFQGQRREADDAEARATRERDKLKADQEAALKKIDLKIREVGDALEALNRAARKTGADLGVELEQALTEVARLRGLVEEAQARSGALETAVTELRSQTETKLTEATERLHAYESARKSADAEAVSKEATRLEAEKKKNAERPPTKEGHYGLAKEKLDAGDHLTARTLFSEFLAKWKDDPLAANAQYWLGESFYAEKKYREAIFEFQKVRDLYPKSDKSSDALVKIAFAFAALGLVDDAKLFLEEVGRTYPKSNAAKLAKEKLAELGKRKQR